jgi:hypothetical protein
MFLLTRPPSPLLEQRGATCVFLTILQRTLCRMGEMEDPAAVAFKLWPSREQTKTVF